MEWWSLRICLSGSEPRRRIGEFFLSRWSWSDECWFFSRQNFLDRVCIGFRTHVAATAVCTTGGRGVHTLTCCKHMFLHMARSQSHSHTSHACHTHAWLKLQVVSKRCLLHMYHTSPSCLLHLMSHPSLLFLDGHFETTLHFDVHTFLSYLLVLKCAGHAAPPHEQREVWLSGQVRLQHRLWAQEVRQNHFSGQWHDARWRSRPQWNLWLLEKHTHENIGLFGVLTMFEPSVSRVSHWWFCSSNRKERKHASGNRLLDRERKEREVSVISVVKSMSKKNRRNSVRSHSLQTLRKFFSDGWTSPRKSSTKSSTSYSWWKFGSEKIIPDWVQHEDPEFGTKKFWTRKIRVTAWAWVPKTTLTWKPINGQIKLNERAYICGADWGWRTIFIKRAKQEVAKKLKNWKDAASRKKILKEQWRSENLSNAAWSGITNSESILQRCWLAEQ